MHWGGADGKETDHWLICSDPSGGGGIERDAATRFGGLFRPGCVDCYVLDCDLAHLFGLFFAWINGILLDVLYGTVLGQHAMAMLFVALAASV